MPKKKEKNTEKVSEIFELEKDKKTEIIKSSGILKEKINSPKEQIKKENNILKYLFIIIAIILLFFVGVYIGSKYLKGFGYQGLRWDTIKAGDIIFYHTVFPVYLDITGGVVKNGERVANHNVYLRNDPRLLEKEVQFKGSLELTEMLVIEGLGNFSCEGYGIASQDGFEQVLGAWGTQVIQDPEADCDLLGRYNFVKLIPGNETKIESYGPKCHAIYIKDCEVFEAKERFLIQEFINRNKKE